MVGDVVLRAACDPGEVAYARLLACAQGGGQHELGRVRESPRSVRRFPALSSTISDSRIDSALGASMQMRSQRSSVMLTLQYLSIF